MESKVEESRLASLGLELNLIISNDRRTMFRY
jgi:hypothetical protein